MYPVEYRLAKLEHTKRLEQAQLRRLARQLRPSFERQPMSTLYALKARLERRRAKARTT